MHNVSEFLVMNIAPLLWPLCAGFILGSIFFGGLWWTVKSLSTVKQPGLWFFVGFVLRMGIVLYGFYWVADGQWPRLVACVLGFGLARLFIRLVVSRSSEQPVILDALHSTSINKSILIEPCDVTEIEDSSRAS